LLVYQLSTDRERRQVGGRTLAEDDDERHDHISPLTGNWYERVGVLGSFKGQWTITSSHLAGVLGVDVGALSWWT
jgi:hypothetical protein